MKTFLSKTLLSLLALGLAAIASWWLYANRPVSKRAKPHRPVPVVRTIEVLPSNEPIVFEASGTVIPAGKVSLLSEVEGRIIEQNPDLVPGGVIAKDDLIVRIDPVDYELQVREQEAEVATAQYELEVEQGKQTIARQEWRILGDKVGKDRANQDLALRRPHLRNARARLDGARSRLEAARLDLARTTIRAPFTGLVQEENVEVGQFVGRQAPIATLVAVDTFWVQVSVPPAILDRIRFPDANHAEGSPARIIMTRGSDAAPLIREGSVFKLQGDLDPKGRLARLLVRVRDPFNLEADNASGPPLLLGSFVQVEIDAGTMNNVHVIPRQALREGDRLWLVNGRGTFTFRDVKVLWRRVDDLLVETELAPDERIIVSRLQSPVPGMEVRDQSRIQARSGQQKAGGPRP